MVKTNYFSGLVKVLEKPKKINIQNKISIVKIYVKIASSRKKTKNQIVFLVFWGNLNMEITKSYQPNDYILIEGYLFTKINKKKSLESKKMKRIFLTVLKVYPVFLEKDLSR